MGDAELVQAKQERNSASKRATLLADERDILKAENARLRARLEAVINLHLGYVAETGTGIYVTKCRLCQTLYPCRTLTALSNEGGDDG